MRIQIPIEDGQEFIYPDLIEYMEAMGRKTKIFLAGKREILAHEMLGEIEKSLNKKKFIRIHDGYIVNIDKVKGYLKDKEISRTYFITESDGIAFISKRRLTEVLEIFENYIKKGANITETLVVMSVVPDENTPQQVFSLSQGKYLIGRKDKPYPADILIETIDRKMSRSHFSIELEKHLDGYSVLTAEVKNFDISTLLNQKFMATGKKHKIENGAIIQAGQTKILFKLKDGNGTTTQVVSRKKHS